MEQRELNRGEASAFDFLGPLKGRVDRKYVKERRSDSWKILYGCSIVNRADIEASPCNTEYPPLLQDAHICCQNDGRNKMERWR